MSRNEIETWVIDWFVKNSSLREDEIREKMSENIFSAGIMDSLKFVFFISEAENAFQIKFSQDDFNFTDGKFNTIKGLCDIVEGHVK